MKNDHICLLEVGPSYLDSGVEAFGIDLDEWIATQTVCTYCSDKQGTPLCDHVE